MKTAIKTALALTAVTIAAQAAAQVTFYEREGFQGDSFTTRRQIADFARFGFNDRASSVVVAGDGPERWQVCEDVRFGGACVVLRPGQYPTLRSMGLNNRISSLQTMAREEPAAPVAGRIVFYEKVNLSGRSFTTQGDVATFAPTGFNDRISSIEVFGPSWEVCRDDGFAGPCVVLREGKYPSLAAMGLDNRISSVRAVGTAGPLLLERQIGPLVADTIWQHARGHLADQFQRLPRRNARRALTVYLDRGKQVIARHPVRPVCFSTRARTSQGARSPHRGTWPTSAGPDSMTVPRRWKSSAAGSRCARAADMLRPVPSCALANTRRWRRSDSTTGSRRCVPWVAKEPEWTAAAALVRRPVPCTTRAAATTKHCSRPT